jgi:hypothetical protein
MQYHVPPYPSRPCSIAASIPARDHMCERPVPARLQFARDQPIGWIGSIVLPEGPLRGAVECGLNFAIVDGVFTTTWAWCT